MFVNVPELIKKDRQIAWKAQTRSQLFGFRLQLLFSKQLTKKFHWQGVEMLRTVEASDLIELAPHGHVIRPSMSQIMALSQLASDIQEALLMLMANKKSKRNGCVPLQTCCTGTTSRQRGMNCREASKHRNRIATSTC